MNKNRRHTWKLIKDQHNQIKQVELGMDAVLLEWNHTQPFVDKIEDVWYLPYLESSDQTRPDQTSSDTDYVK